MSGIRNTSHLVLLTIFVVGMTGINSCSSSNERVDDVNPGYDAVTGEVPIKFLFNVATGNTSNTRMSQSDVQATESDVFRGMDQTVLMSFNLPLNGKFISSPVVADKLNGMGPINSGIVGPNSASSSRFVADMALPVGVNTLMFWGKANKTGSDDAQGKMEFGVAKDISKNTFRLCKRVPDDATETYNKTVFGHYETLLVTILNTIMQSEVTKDGVTVKWSDYATVNGAGSLQAKSSSANDKDPSNPSVAICSLGETLSNLFVTVNTIYQDEFRAGSGAAVQLLLSDLYPHINIAASSSVSSQEEKVAKELAEAIQSNMLKVLTTNGKAFLPIPTIVSNLGLTTIAIPAGNNDLTKFPSVFGLPEGSAILQFDVVSSAYSYRSQVPVNTGSGMTFDVDYYMYPPELCYFGNSPIRVTDSTLVSADYPQGTTSWDADASWSSHHWAKDSRVQPTTRSVAMQHSINYGTSLLKTTVRYGAKDLEDNNHAIQLARYGSEEENTTIDATSSPFTFIGLLIGGQPSEVGWNYLAKGTVPTFNALIYDQALNSGGSDQQTIPAYDASATSQGRTQPVYTLVFDNWDISKSGSDQNDVYIALEFVNNSGEDFWGQDNLIRKGSTFYIIGKLDPDEIKGATPAQIADKSYGITWPTNYALPPYDADGNTLKERRVFIQDYMTEAHFVIGQTSLQKAFVSLPDLRSSENSLGLSVDVTWTTGLKFSIIFGQ